jgi:hypothetical protein
MLSSKLACFHFRVHIQISLAFALLFTHVFETLYAVVGRFTFLSRFIDAWTCHLNVNISWEDEQSERYLHCLLRLQRIYRKLKDFQLRIETIDCFSSKSSSHRLSCDSQSFLLLSDLQAFTSKSNSKRVFPLQPPLTWFKALTKNLIQENS